MTFNPKNLPTRTMRGGATYMDVKHRLVWLREDAPDSTVETELVQLSAEVAVFRAVVRRVVEGEIKGSASGYGSETPGDFRDYIEKAETKAIGRALAGLGYGTQFLEDDGEALADSPVQKAASKAAAAQAGPPLSGPVADALARAFYGALDASVLRSNHRSELAAWMAQHGETGVAVLAEYATAIYQANDEASLQAVGVALQKAGISDTMLRAAWKRRKTELDAATSGASGGRR